MHRDIHRGGIAIPRYVALSSHSRTRAVQHICPMSANLSPDSSVELELAKLGPNLVKVRPIPSCPSSGRHAWNQQHPRPRPQSGWLPHFDRVVRIRHPALYRPLREEFTIDSFFCASGKG